MALDHLKTDVVVEEETDFISDVMESGVYDFVVDMAYFGKSQGGANSMTLHLKTAAGAALRTTLWITSGDAKGNKNYFVNKNTGKNQHLPGFAQANAICLLGIGKEIHELTTEVKKVKVYSAKESKEVLTDCDVPTELLGAEITCGVVKQTVDKTVKNAQGVYVPNGETKDENEINKCFRTSDGLTTAEIRAGDTVAAFKDKWAKSNTGKTRMKAKGATVGATSTTSTGAAPTATASLFK